MNNSQKYNKVQILGCPWCDQQPVADVKKYHNCGEPYSMVNIHCSKCHAGFSVNVHDDEHREAEAMWPNYKHIAPADLLIHVVLKKRLLKMWNTRITTNIQ